MKFGEHFHATQMMNPVHFGECIALLSSATLRHNFDLTQNLWGRLTFNLMSTFKPASCGDCMTFLLALPLGQNISFVHKISGNVISGLAYSMSSFIHPKERLLLMVVTL